MAKYDKYRSFKKPSGKQIPPEKIIAWVEKNFEFKIRKNGIEYLICDPFDYDTKFRFNINPEMGVCNSWHGNEWAGPVNPETGKRNCSFLKFVRVYKKCSYTDALKDILGASEDVSEFLRPENRGGTLEAQKKVAVAFPDGVELLANATDKQAALLRKWLISRGYIDEAIAKYELYYLGMEVYWPYFEFDTMIYWQSRSRVNKRFQFPDAHVYDESGEIIGETEGSKGHFLYGFDEVEPANYLVLTEAIFDQHTLGSQALAIGGAILTDTQIKKIKLLGPKKGVILAPDNDMAGYKSVLVNYRLLERSGFKVFVSYPPELTYMKDGRECTVKDFNELFTECKLSLKQIRDQFDENIKPITVQETVGLRAKINTMGRIRR